MCQHAVCVPSPLIAPRLVKCNLWLWTVLVGIAVQWDCGATDPCWPEDGAYFDARGSGSRSLGLLDAFQLKVRCARPRAVLRLAQEGEVICRERWLSL